MPKNTSAQPGTSPEMTKTKISLFERKRSGECRNAHNGKQSK
jgi:hypothetical protein